MKKNLLNFSGNTYLNWKSKTMLWLKRPLIAGLISLSFTGTAFGLSAGGPAEAWTLSAIGLLTGAVSSSIVTFGSTFGTQLTLTFEQMISGIAVATKQESVAGNQISDSIQNTGLVLAESLKLQKQTAKVAEATFDYSPQVGQGVDPCRVISERQTLANQVSEIDQKMPTMIEQLPIDNKPGTYTNNLEETLKKRMDEHTENFCSEQEDAQGICDKSELAGADMNASLLFKDVVKGSGEDKARMSYIQNIAGDPVYIPSNGNNLNSIEAKQQINAALEQQAFMSIPMHSLNTIRMRHLKPSDEALSYNELLDKHMQSYVGGEKSSDWNKKISMQTQRGLMVESLKAQGMQTWLRQKQYADKSRQEANLAALLLLSQKQQQAELQKAFSKTN